MKRVEVFGQREAGTATGGAGDKAAPVLQILAGAIQFGNRCFGGHHNLGKAMVPTVQRMNDGSAIKMTTAQYYTPRAGASRARAYSGLRGGTAEDGVIGEYKQGKDPQLAKAGN